MFSGWGSGRSHSGESALLLYIVESTFHSHNHIGWDLHGSPFNIQHRIREIKSDNYSWWNKETLACFPRVDSGLVILAFWEKGRLGARAEKALPLRMSEARLIKKIQSTYDSAVKEDSHGRT